MRDYIGGFEGLVLLAGSVHEPISGANVGQVLEAASGSVVSPGALYTTLGRLVEKGYLVAVARPASSVRGGRSGSNYSATETGKQVLADSDVIRNRIFAIV